MLRTHDLVLADGTFSVVLTPKHRVVAVLDAYETLLGPMHIAIEIEREPFLDDDAPPYVLEPSFVTSGFFDEVAHFVTKAADGAFDATAHASPSMARPAFDILKDAAGEGFHALTKALPANIGKPLDTAAHVVMKAKFGDLNAKQFLSTIATAANSGVPGAQRVGDVLLDATKLVANVIPSGSNANKGSAGDLFSQMVSAIQKGNFKDVERMAKQGLGAAQGVISLIPGVGTGISAAIGTGVAALNGGNPIEIAIRAAYGAIPIPVGVRQVTDIVVDSVLALLEHPQNLTDVAVQVARDRVPDGLPRQVFDTLVQIGGKHTPIQKGGPALVDHFVAQYAPHGDAILHVPQFGGRMVQPLHTLNG